jgi:DNA-binding beta-propeller fold protein YncE
MPVAEPITGALEAYEDSTWEAVSAVRDIARTLAGLAERGIAHRDLKPGNLFRLNDQWVVGDFGLVDYPDKQALTRPNQKLGPAHFVADEMVNQPDTADPHPADVFSLAKTLWVLCVPGQEYPPSGQHRIEVAPATVGHWVAAPRLEHLDLLIERATALAPETRPSMAEFADELTAWLADPPTPEAPDLSAAAARISALSEAGLRAKQIHDRRRELFQAAMDVIEKQVGEFVEQLATVFPTVSRLRNPPLMSDFGDTSPPAHIEQAVARGAAGTNADPDAVALTIGIAAQWLAEDDARYAGWVHVEDPYAGSRLLWSDAGGASLGSAKESQLLAVLRDGLAEQLPAAAQFVAGRMELRTSRDRHAAWHGEESGVRLSYPSTAFAPFGEGDTGCCVVDTGNRRIRRFGPGGAQRDWAWQPGESTDQDFDPLGGCFTHERKVWVADHDNSRLLYFDENGAPLHGFGETGPHTEVLSGPADVATVPDGTVFVVDRRHDSVFVFNTLGTLLHQWGGSGREPGQLSVPCGIAARHGTYIYVSDSGNDRIQKFDRHGNLMACWGGSGGADGYFRTPHGIALDAEENVYVADSRNHRVQQFDSNGELLRVWGSAGENPGQFLEPRGVAIDGVGNVYVVEHTGQRVQRFGPAYFAAL